jgi:glycosyltransferase involved in cell wall biosynthesis
MYNRERFIARAINSCLQQDFEDFEIIVVDDCSTDASAKIVQNINDPRIILIRHNVNQERLIARNTGARASKGDWIIWFDSDDELLPNALTIIKQRISELPSDVMAMRFMCRLDSGLISPAPPYSDEILDYEGYICWIESHYGKWSESLPVVNKETIRSVLFPEDPWYTSETQYHLDVASKYRIKTCTDVVRLYHLDAYNNTWNPNIKKMLLAAPAFANRMEHILTVHGQSIIKWAPRTYKIWFSGMLTQLLLSGQRWKSLRFFLKALRSNNISLRILIIMILGIIHHRLLAYAKTTGFRNTPFRS